MVLKYNPTTLIVDQTVLCNQECFFCWRVDRSGVKAATKAAPHTIMPANLYREIIDQGAHHGLRRLSLCGPMGEPTLVPDLASRGLYAKQKGFGYTLINTNGVALNRHDPVDLLSAFDEVCVSLDAVDEAIYTEIHGKPGQHARVLDNIEALIEVNPRRVKVRFTESDRNAGHWPALRERFEGRCGIVRKRVHSFIDMIAIGGGAETCNQPGGSVNFTFAGDMTTCCINYKMAPTFGHISEGLKACWEGEAFESWRASRLDGLCRDCTGLGQHGLEHVRY